MSEHHAEGQGADGVDAQARDDVRPAVLVVDDHPENVRVIELILEPLDVEVRAAYSGEEALRTLLEVDVAVIVLDVRMPGMDGFETAAFVKQRERTRHVPIIFLTAMANDRDQALSGYQAGAVDFIEKPVEPLVLQAKVAAFAELHAARLEVERQGALLRQAEAREAAREIQELRERGERRYQELAEAMPSMVFALDPDGSVSYRSSSWGEYTGGVRMQSVAVSSDSEEWMVVHPTDRAMTQRMWANAIQDPESLRGGQLEVRVRIRRHDGAWLWHLVRTTPRFDKHGRCTGWVGTATEIDTSERIATTQRALSEVGAALVNSADPVTTLQLVAGMAVDEMVDWCSIDVIEDDGIVHRRALQVDGHLEHGTAAALARVLPPDGPNSPVERVLGADRPQRVLLDSDGAVMADEDRDSARAICVPLVVRGECIGAIAVAVASDGRRLGEPERVFARSLATRVAPALDGARQFRRAQDRAQAAEVLEAIADGVALIDQDGVVRLWNPAAATITGLHPDDVLGARIEELLPSWSNLVERVPVSVGGAPRSGVTTVPLTTASGRDVWLSVSAVGFARGVAFAFRDLTEERAVERMKSDFVATVSHELRTPLTSIHGAAVTLTREDIELPPEVHDNLLEIISQQSVQLAEIVDSVLTASRIDAGQVDVRTEPVDLAQLVRDVVDATRARLGNERGVRLELPNDVPLVAADRVHLRQVLENLVENAIKYSPGGEDIIVRVFDRDGSVQVEVEDRGIGIAPHDHRRIFEKFYRADADMTLGVGGTGLGLFIVRELVRQMSGRIEVHSTPGQGSTFQVTLPTAAAVERSTVVDGDEVPA